MQTLSCKSAMGGGFTAGLRFVVASSRLGFIGLLDAIRADVIGFLVQRPLVGGQTDA